MPEIQLLSQDTIDKIAAGEVVERPSSVVKELVENAIDAGASAVTVEIKEGGTSLIRITDNGCGIPHSQVPIAFLRHSTSKIRSIEDLVSVSSLGFRGEALSSIAAVARVELITKTRDEITGTRYCIEGSRELSNEEIGAPDGTTFLVKDLFYNTPARRKFLKTPHTEGNYISEIVDKLALSHPEVSFKYIQNNATKLHTSGNGKTKDLIYHIFGRDITASLIEVHYDCDYFTVDGFIGKPIINRGNRNYESFFINGRYVKSSLISKAIEDAYKNYLMQHQYPFTVLYFRFKSDLDVNVHPTKMELRFADNQEVYKELCNCLYGYLSHRDIIPDVPVDDKEEKPAAVPAKEDQPLPEPFEQRRLNDLRKAVSKDSPYEVQYPSRRPLPQSFQHQPSHPEVSQPKEENEPASKPEVILLGKRRTQTAPSAETASVAAPAADATEPAAISKDPLAVIFPPSADSVKSPSSAGANKGYPQERRQSIASFFEQNSYGKKPASSQGTAKEQQPAKPLNTGSPEDIPYEEMTLEQIQPGFMTKDARRKYQIIGQLFKTYWLVEYQDKLFIIDQHAAHEKVLYEQTMKRLKDKVHTSQMITPPIVLSLDSRETEMLEKYRPQIERIGYEVEHFGGREYMITAVPGNLFHLDMKDLFIEMLDDFTSLTGRETPDLILEKVASMSCKAAVKGNNKLSLPEIEALFDELLSLDNPYNCPHGRPTIISMTKYEIEKKFKRIV